MTAAPPRVSTALMRSSTVRSPPVTEEEEEARGGLQAAAEVEVRYFRYIFSWFDNCRWRRIQASLQPLTLPHAPPAVRRQEAGLRRIRRQEAHGDG